ncbi:rod shape-determining protein MreD [Leptobacterium flavescens]|uniref:Rod shape-determining protein MreD n=1 Tax=Leptobacterium flavescens TaxID=472055 RepID=A0A6P0USK2_9FLAO|nr:rod shape-determining protein MreD [Leptobacterium flavescens]NER14799.1 rod shape-determining protein MreD [Leptobacterium flavescens]
MNSDIILNIVRFILLVLAQVLVFNHIDFLGFINPYIYILFILLYPIKKENRAQFLFLAFLIGFFVDLFSDTGGVNAAASVCIAYIRPVVLKFAFGNIYEYQIIKISNTPIGQRVVYLIIMILIHHLILFGLEIFSFSNILSILKNTLFSSVFTVFLCLLIIPLLRKAKS